MSRRVVDSDCAALCRYAASGRRFRPELQEWARERLRLFDEMPLSARLLFIRRAGINPVRVALAWYALLGQLSPDIDAAFGATEERD